MQRKHGELAPLGEVVTSLDDVSAVRKASPQARRGFTVADQVNQLVAASEADPDMGFMARLMALCSLPRTNPGNQHQYKRVNGNYRSSGLLRAVLVRFGRMFNFVSFVLVWRSRCVPVFSFPLIFLAD